MDAVMRESQSYPQQYSGTQSYPQQYSGTFDPRRLGTMITEFHRKFFSKLSDFISYRPTLLMATCILVALGVSVGNYYVELKNDFRTGFSTPWSNSWAVRDFYREFFNLTSDPYTIVLFGESTDGESMLRQDHFFAMKEEAERGLQRQLVGNGIENDTLATHLQFSSKPLYEAIGEAIRYPNEYVEMGYPKMNMYGINLTTRNVFYRYNNGSVGTLLYLFIFLDNNQGAISSIKRAEVEWSNELKRIRDDSVVHFQLFGDEIVNKEIFIGSVGSLPYFFIGAFAMVTFIFFSIQRYEQTVARTAFLTFWTTFCPFLAGLTSVAIFSLLGHPLNSSMLITPFLVLAVGVDDAFLMLHEWFTSGELDPVSRLNSVLVEIGPSITLASVTNICAFLVGSFLSPYAIREFCYCSVVALTIDWLLQFLVFAPVLLKFQFYSFDVPGKSSKKSKKMFRSYCEFLQHSTTRIILLCILFPYWICSGFLALRMEENFTPEKTFQSDSFLTNALPALEKAFIDHEIFPVFVKRIPDTAPELLDAVARVHNLSCLCPNYTTWIEDYAARYGLTNGTMQEFFGDILNYLDFNPDLGKNIILHFDSNGTAIVDKISFDLCIHGYGSWRDRAYIHDQIRKLMSPEILPYDYDCTLFDIILTARETMLQSCIITAITMLFLCALFIPNFQATIFVLLAMVSITIGIVGGLSAWGADMDIIVTISVVMAIGLTVDYAAHINYHYFVMNAMLPTVDRMSASLETVTYATAQAAATTIICVLPLYFYNVYMYVTFAETIILCAALGFLHTVVVIPFLLMFF